jgi:hypothetical protein
MQLQPTPFGTVEIIQLNIPGGDGKGRLARCRCFCGRVFMALQRKLVSGKHRSCGCLRVRRLVTHGECRSGKITREYKIWNGMISRCRPSGRAHKYYAGRGITICERWKNSFAAFLEDMGRCPPGLTLDRIDNSRGYDPGNCRWATRKQQSRNTRSNHIIEHNGERLTVVSGLRS